MKKSGTGLLIASAVYLPFFSRHLPPLSLTPPFSPSSFLLPPLFPSSPSPFLLRSSFVPFCPPHSQPPCCPLLTLLLLLLLVPPSSTSLPSFPTPFPKCVDVFLFSLLCVYICFIFIIKCCVYKCFLL